MISPGTPKTTKIIKRRYKRPSKDHLEKNTRKSIGNKPVLAMEREARLNTILYKVFPKRGKRERESERVFLIFHVFYEGVFQNLAFCSRVAPNYSRMAPQWLPKSTQNGSPDTPRRPPKHDSEKGSLIPPKNTARGSKKTPQMDTQIRKSRSRMSCARD